MSCLRASRVRTLLGVLASLIALAVLPGCGDSNAESAVDPATTPLTTRQRVQTVHVRTGQLDAKDRVSGIAHAFHKTHVTAEIRARVVRRAVENGDSVEEGQLLVELDATRLELELRHTEATLKARISDFAHAQREFQRGEKLSSQNAISAQKRDDLRHGLDSARDAKALAVVSRDTAKRNLEDASIRSPFTGTVEGLAVDLGDYVSPGTPVATVVELSRARVFAGVTAQEAARLAGATLTLIQFSALGGTEIEAEIKSVGNLASERDGTYTVEIWVDSPPNGLRDGMTASVRLPSDGLDDRPLAPRSALMRRAGQPEVFVVEQNGDGAVARVRAIRTGRSSGEWIEVLDGLLEGEEVIVDGQFALRDGVAIIADPSTARAR
jgi:membrane fusion protein (multidrug efflux system)